MTFCNPNVVPSERTVSRVGPACNSLACSERVISLVRGCFLWRMIGCLDPYKDLESCHGPPTRSTFEESMNECRDKRGLDELRGHLVHCLYLILEVWVLDYLYPVTFGLVESLSQEGRWKPVLIVSFTTVLQESKPTFCSQSCCSRIFTLTVEGENHPRMSNVLTMSDTFHF